MSISPLSDQDGPVGAMIALGWLLMVGGWLVSDNPCSLVLFVIAVGVLAPEAMRGLRARRRRTVR